jgi:trans-AT polyketide synthase/acyltransferase/oxidoreductase domain-containing protein
MIAPATLGSEAFRRDYGVRAAYVAGAMVKGIASAGLVIRMGRAGLLSFFGSGGVGLEGTGEAIAKIQAALGPGEPYGVNLLANAARPREEMALVDLLLARGVRNVEASAYLQLTPAVVKFRLKDPRHRVIAKVSRPEVAQQFLAPAPEEIVRRLVEDGHLTREEAARAPRLPVASDLCVEADSGGHTDMGVTSVLLPAMARLRDESQQRHGFEAPVRVGSAGGLGTPESLASAFVLGADFVLTGSINQCTVEAGTSEAVKDMLQALDVHDTAYAPAGDLFEMGAKIQVMKKGVFFPSKANRLHELWRNHDSVDALDAGVRREIQDKYFRRSFEDVWAETREHYALASPAEIERAERHPKARMALLFRWYFVHTMRLALSGEREQRVDYQVHTGPAVGAFNRWVRGTRLEDWRNRHVDVIADELLEGCAEYMGRRLRAFA